MQITVQLFSHLRMAIGKSTLDLELPEGAAASKIIERLQPMVSPELENVMIDTERGGYRLIFVVNGCRLSPHTILHDGDVVSLLAPLGGG